MKKTSPYLSYIDRFRFWNTRAHGGKSPVGGTEGNQPVKSDSQHPDTQQLHLHPSGKTGSDVYPSAVHLNYPPHQDDQIHNSSHASSSHQGTAGGVHNTATPAQALFPSNVRGQVGQPFTQDASARAVLNNPELNEKTPDPNSNLNSNLNSNINVNPNPDSNPDSIGNGGDGGDAVQQQPSLLVKFGITTKKVLLHSKINYLLVFVPVGIVVAQFDEHISPGVIFAMNAIAIIPLAGLLSHATESVARKLGDTIGALLNVTFGNAVELIIFIALVKNEIRIVQASLLGSVLANLLLILGMSFLLGGLRFREQIYNSTVTQMSACLLSLSVSSLVLPTAFYWSFKDTATADQQSLKISRGTSVVLFLVYAMYLLFQLKSHAYMYESTPQHIIDAESTPGPAHNWLDSSSSDDDSSSSSDSDDSRHSRDTISRRIHRVMHVGRRRKSSVVSNDTVEAAARTRTSSFGTNDATPVNEEGVADETMASPFSTASPLSRANTLSLDNEEAVDDGVSYRSRRSKSRRHRHRSLRHYRRSKKKADKASSRTATDSRDFGLGEQPIAEDPEILTKDRSSALAAGEPRCIDFAVADVSEGRTADLMLGAPAGRRTPFNGLRDISLRPIVRSIAPSVFIQPMDSESTLVPVSTGPVPRVRYGIRRTNSLPDRLTAHYHHGQNQSAMMPSQIPLATLSGGAAAAAATSKDEALDDLSRRSAIILLLISTGLVAVCAEFMVDSINGLVASTSVGEIFIGLIILPIVGNAAEHVTAITVAMKNKMDLAIGVAVGSSIQIALFITPLIVILGWILDRDMSLYFTLFETVCLFVSAFIVNFLVLDGRSNYLEGALLCATYAIISLVAFYYPNVSDASGWGS